MNKRTLSWIATIMLIVSVSVCGFTLWYVISSKDSITKELRTTIEELKKYNFPKDEVKDVTLDEAKLYLAVAKYCEENNDCKGKDGISPACILEPSQCRGADAPIPVKGVDYNDGITPPCYFTINQCQGDNGVNGTDGTNGTDGANGKPVLRRCNPETNRMEWQLEGDESWQPEYNLAPGQTCVEAT